MNTRSNYIINNRTSALASYYELTNEYTRVVQGPEIFIVRQTPDEIVRASFHYYENNLEGAIHLARKILKRSDNVPIALSAAHNLILTRCKALNQDGVVWLICSQIQGIQRYRINKATVLLKNGPSIQVDIKVNALQDQRSWGACLCSSLLIQSASMKTKRYLYDRKKGIAFIWENGQLNYFVKRNKEDDEDLDLVLK